MDGGQEPIEEANDMHTDEEREVEPLVSSAAEAAEKDAEAMAGDEGIGGSAP